jgi:hypothetical protein
MTRACARSFAPPGGPCVRNAANVVACAAPSPSVIPCCQQSSCSCRSAPLL